MNKHIIARIQLLALLASPTAWAEDLPQAVNKKQEMVVSANPLASKAGADILKKGGTAADAMVAVQTVLGLVEPQSSGIGGGAFVVYYDAKTGTTTTIDAREKAPAAATEDRFVDKAIILAIFLDRHPASTTFGVPDDLNLFPSLQLTQFLGPSHWPCPYISPFRDKVGSLLSKNANA